MAFLHKISGYLVDVNEDYFEEDIVTEIEQGMDLFSQHLHVETAQIKGWDDENPLNYLRQGIVEPHLLVILLVLRLHGDMRRKLKVA